jgi:hypothetical protein
VHHNRARRNPISRKPKGNSVSSRTSRTAATSRRPPAFGSGMAGPPSPGSSAEARALAEAFRPADGTGLPRDGDSGEGYVCRHSSEWARVHRRARQRQVEGIVSEYRNLKRVSLAHAREQDFTPVAPNSSNSTGKETTSISGSSLHTPMTRSWLARTRTGLLIFC